MRNLLKLGTKRLIQYGQFADFYEYSKEFAYNYAPLKISNSGEKKIQIEKSDYSLNRARQSIYRMVEANKGIKNSFFTLTFRENITDLKFANREFSKFVMRLRFFYPALKYLAVPEFQKRGAVHFHMVLFDSPYLHWKKLTNLWGLGMIDIQKSKNILVLGAYVAKYLKKNMTDLRLLGQKSYFTSRNLIRPLLYRNSETIDFFLLSDNMEVLEQQSYIGYGRVEINYKKIKLRIKNI